MSGQDSFDYIKMAEGYAANAGQLDAAIERLKAEPAQGMDERSRKNSRLLLLEEERMESWALYRVCMRKAKERGQVERKCKTCVYYGVDLTEFICHLHLCGSGPDDTCQDWKAKG